MAAHLGMRDPEGAHCYSVWPLVISSVISDRARDAEDGLFQAGRIASSEMGFCISAVCGATETCARGLLSIPAMAVYKAAKCLGEREIEQKAEDFIEKEINLGMAHSICVFGTSIRNLVVNVLYPNTKIYD